MAALQVSADHAFPVSAEGQTVTISNTGGGTVYYSSRQDVSAGLNDGSLTVGQSLSATTEVWVRADSYTSITVTYAPLPIGLSPALASSTGLNAGKVPSADGAGSWIYADPLQIDPRRAPYNAKFDLFSSIHGSMSSTVSPTQVTLSDYTFTTADVGKQIKIVGAAAAGANLKTTITAVAAGAAVVGIAASTTVSSATVIFGTDDTAALNACFTDLSSASRTHPLGRTCLMPEGAALFSQLVFPRFGNVVGAGETWANFGFSYSFFGGNENTGGTLLYQMWGQNQDAIRVTESSSGSGTYIGAMIGFVVQQDLDNTSGKGIAFRKTDNTALWIIDGAKIKNISVQGFASAGFEMPLGAMPGKLENLHAFANGFVDGAAGVVYTCHAGGDSIEFDFLSGDQNSGGLLHLIGQGASLTAAAIFISNMKSEFAPNVYRSPGGAPQQANAIVLESMTWARVTIKGLHHHADGNSTPTALGAAILIPTGSVAPEVSWEGMQVTIQSPQTNTTAYALTDTDVAVNIAVSTTGRGSWGNGGLIVEGSRGGNLRKVLSNAPGGYSAQGVFGEQPGLQIAGAQPTLHVFNGSAASGKQHMAWVQLSTGAFVLRGLTAALGLDDDAITLNRLAPGITTTIPKLVTNDYVPWLTMRNRLDAPVAQTTELAEGSNGVAGGSNGGNGVFYLDPADWANGRTANLRLRCVVVTNATAPACNFTFGLYPVTALGGGAAAVNVTFGTVVSGSTALFTTPAATSTLKVDSGDFTAPAAGDYAVGVVVSANAAANSSIAVRAQVERRAQ